ncbi:MAG: DUF4129 domain-containing protein [Clostridia bacterium]|nr:DUF4129 domain-containing protein [Clostridia bacterium]
MRRNTANDIHWMRRYKTIAVVGMTAVIATVMEWLTLFAAGNASAYLTILFCPIGIGTGYLVEHIALRITRTKESDEIDFSYESKIKIPRKLTFVCWLITTVLMVLMAFAVVTLINLLRIRLIGTPLEHKVLIAYQILLGAILTIAGCIGCYLRPCAFYQIVGLRSLIECVAVFTFVGAIQSIYGASQTVSWFFVSCIVVYMLCVAIIMNQMYVIQPSYFSPTCHATDELRYAGLKAVLGMFGSCLKYLWLLVAGMSLLVFPWRVITCGAQADAFSWIFAFPFVSRPVINLTVFVCALITLIAFIAYVCLRAKDPDIDRYLSKIKEFFRRVWLSIRLLVVSAPSELRHLRKTKPKTEQEDTRQIQTVYEDTVILRPRRAQREEVVRYSTFSRRLLSLPDAKAQYCYAYRTLVACLIRKYIGIDAHTTPQEIAQIVKNRTNIHDIDRITALFYASAYAPEAPAPTVNELVALCEIVRAELERERKANR